AVDAVHEVRQVDQPDEIENSQHISQPAQTDDMAQNRKRRQSAEPCKHPCGGDHVSEEPPPSRERTMIVDEPNAADECPSAGESTDERPRQQVEESGSDQAG